MSTADLSEFFKLSRPKKKPCQIGFAVESGQITKADAGNLKAACDADKGIITSGAIQQWLANRDVKVSVPAVTAHRTGTCSCHD